MSAGQDPREAGNVHIVHERFTEIAGSEHVVQQLATVWPDSTVHAALVDPTAVPDGIPMPHPSGLDALHRRLGRRSYAPLAPMMPFAFRRMKLPHADVVLVSHHAFATQVVHATEAPVIAYVHSPARWAWEPEFRRAETGSTAAMAALSALALLARRMESEAAPRLAGIIANSNAVADRIQRWWGRESTVVHPPVDTDAFTVGEKDADSDYFLLAGRLVPYKRPDLAIRAAARAGVRLVVAGDGRHLAHSRDLAQSNVEFTGRVSHADLVNLYRGARAVIMPGIEDFGIVPVEAMACGTPVVAVGAGGALDTVRHGESGLLVAPGPDEQVIDELAETLRTFDASTFDPQQIRRWAEGFSRSTFRERIAEVVARV